MKIDMLSKARASCEYVDLTAMLLLERFNHDSEYRANALSVASHISGAPIAGVQKVLDRLELIGMLERFNEYDFRVTQLGIEVLLAEVDGFQPSSKEQRRRDKSVLSGGL